MPEAGGEGAHQQPDDKVLNRNRKEPARIHVIPQYREIVKHVEPRPIDPDRPPPRTQLRRGDRPTVHGVVETFGPNRNVAIRVSSETQYLVQTSEIYHERDPRTDKALRAAYAANWPTAAIDCPSMHPNARNGIIPMVRGGILPNPRQHFEQIVQRQPYLEPLRDWFLEYAIGHYIERPDPEAPKGGTCGGQFFGYPIGIHFVCAPYVILTVDNYHRYLATSFPFLCVRCGNRSRTHKPCEGKPCWQCQSTEHCGQMRACGEDDFHSKIQRYRLEHFIHMAALADNGWLEYRFLSDSPDERTERHQHPLPLGFVNTDHQIQAIPDNQYRITGYPGLASPFSDAYYRSPRFFVTDEEVYEEIEAAIRSEEVPASSKPQFRIQCYPRVNEPAFRNWEPTTWPKEDPKTEDWEIGDLQPDPHVHDDEDNFLLWCHHPHLVEDKRPAAETTAPVRPSTSTLTVSSTVIEKLAVVEMDEEDMATASDSDSTKTTAGSLKPFRPPTFRVDSKPTAREPKDEGSDGDEELDVAASISSTGSWLSTLTTAEWLEHGHPNNAARSAIKCTSRDSTALVSAMNTHPVDESPTGKNNLENPGLKRFAKGHDDFGDFSAVSSTGSWSSTLTTAEWLQPGHSVHFRLDSTSSNVESTDLVSAMSTSKQPYVDSPLEASTLANMETPSMPHDSDNATMDA